MFDNSGETAIAEIAAPHASPDQQTRAKGAAVPRATSRLAEALRRIAKALEISAEPEVPAFKPQNTRPSTEVFSTSSAPVAAAKSPVSPAAAGSDRRTHPRWGSACEVLACVKSGNPGDDLDWIFHRTNLRGRLTDISMGGLSLKLNEPVPADTVLIFRLTNRHFEKSVDAEGTVLRCLPNPDGTATLVCRLMRKLSFEQVHLLGKQLFDSTIV